MILTETQLVCPVGRPGDAPLIIDMAAIVAAERRQQEVASLSKLKAPELLWIFNKNWLDLNSLLARLQLEKNVAQKELEKRKAILLLDVIPEKLKERKIPSNDANREAFITLDEEYSRLEDTFMQITAVVKYLEGKLKSFENAYSSVKKLVGQDPYGMGGNKSPYLSGGTESPQRAMEREPEAPQKTHQEEPPPAPTRTGFGKARY